jgi:hypothetical protein
LTRLVTIVALTCFLVAGAAATSILGRDSVPAGPAMVSAAVKSPAANRESKQDRLKVTRLALASPLSEPLRQAYASSIPADLETPKIAVPAVIPPKPKLAAKPPRLRNPTRCSATCRSPASRSG